MVQSRIKMLEKLPVLEAVIVEVRLTGWGGVGSLDGWLILWIGWLNDKLGFLLNMLVD